MQIAAGGGGNAKAAQSAAKAAQSAAKAAKSSSQAAKAASARLLRRILLPRQLCWARICGFRTQRPRPCECLLSSGDRWADPQSWQRQSCRGRRSIDPTCLHTAGPKVCMILYVGHRLRAPKS